MKSFLTSRCQITTVEGCRSAPAEIGAGVPQGAIISPLLFSLAVYVNDISSATPASKINLFADDTSAYVSSQAPSVLNSDLQTTANSLSGWFSCWHLSVYPAKTVCMVLHSKGIPPCQLNIKINDNHITQVARYRHLGVTFNVQLSWKDHINQSAKKIGLLRPSPWQATVFNRCPGSLCIQHQAWYQTSQDCLKWPQFFRCCTLRAI